MTGNQTLKPEKHDISKFEYLRSDHSVRCYRQFISVLSSTLGSVYAPSALRKHYFKGPESTRQTHHITKHVLTFIDYENMIRG